MKEFSNLVGVTLIGNASKMFQFLADEFTFEPSAAEDNGGIYWDCSKTFVVDMPDSEAFKELKVPRKAIVNLTALVPKKSAAGSYMISLGTEQVPARVYLSPHLNKAQLVVSCKMLKNPLG